MSDLRKAEKRVFELLEIAQGDLRDATEILRQALAHPEQEPKAWYHAEDYKTHFTTSPSQDMIENGYWQPLYTAPPKREWVGYTNEDRERIVPVLVQSLLNHDDKTMAVLLKAILIDVEEQLKEKNK